MKFLISFIFLTTFYFVSANSITKSETIYETQNSSSKTLEVHFIDVGGGDGILINTPSQKKILIDGGFSWLDRGKAKKEYLEYLETFIQDDVIDLIVISHPDYDHFGALPHVLENYTVKQIWSSGYFSEELSQAWDDFLVQLEDDKDTHFLSPLEDFIGIGSQIRFDDSNTYDKSDDTVLTILNSKEKISKKAYSSGRSMDESQMRNSSSIVLRLDFGNTSFLFTGDTNGRKKGSEINQCDDQEKFMLDNNNNPDNPVFNLLDCDVLKVSHHGSDGSSSLPFLKAVSPNWAVIPAGYAHGHPHQETLDRLAHDDVGLTDDQILRTDDKDTGRGNEKNLGDDCYIFRVSPDKIYNIEKWNVKLN